MIAMVSVSVSAPSCDAPLTRRSAVLSIGRSSQPIGSVPKPGMGRVPGGWNMLRTRVVALMGAAMRAGDAGVSSAGAAPRRWSRTKKPRCLRASTRPWASSCQRA